MILFHSAAIAPAGGKITMLAMEDSINITSGGITGTANDRYEAYKSISVSGNVALTGSTMTAYGSDESKINTFGAAFTATNGAKVILNGVTSFGAAVTDGASSSDSNDDLADTTNDFDYYGFSLYTGYHFNNLSADIGCTWA